MSDDAWQPNFGHLSTEPPAWAAKRPLRVALLGDFGGGALSGRMDGADELGRRKPLKVEFDTLEDAIARLGLTLTLPIGAEGAAVEVPITDTESFHPDQLYQNVEVFSALSDLRRRLNTPSTFAKAAAEVQTWGDEALRKASAVSRQTRSQSGTLSAGSSLDDFARLTGRASRAQEADTAVDGLLRRIIGPFITPADSPDKATLLAAVDAALSDAMTAVLHHPDFQNMESLWRGVDFLLRRLETSHQLQVHLIDVSAEEFAADLSSHDDLCESGLYKLLVDTPSQEEDGGYSYLVGCYHFEATPPQLELLGRAALLGAAAGAPFLSAIDTSAFSNRKEPPHRLVRDTVKALRESPQASFLGLFGPRFLLRHPYGKKSEPISSFAFEEFSRQTGLRSMLWGHPALLALCVLCVRGAQLTINELPFHHYLDDDGDSTALPCTERLVSTTVATLLRDAGINGLMAFKGQPLVRLTGVSAINGGGLATQSAPRSGLAVERGAVHSKTPVKTDWTPEARSGGTVSVSTPMRTEEANNTPAEDSAGEPQENATTEAPAEEAPAAVDDELAALLASLDAPATPAEEEPAMDPDLEALLKSLG
jgi:type VI secretion system protein ImpC